VAVRPEAEAPITPALVHDLLSAQHPDLADLPLGATVEGWDNVSIRLGDTLAVRLPRRAMGADLVRNEQRWLPTLAAHCPLPVPAPVRTGTPTDDYPWAWSVVPWFDGSPADAQPVADRAVWATVLADALTGLHSTDAPADAPRNPVRGGPLTTRESVLVERLAVLDLGDAAHALWHRAVTASPWPHAPRWLHGDPHPANLLVTDGRLSALLDFGDMSAGDPACDLATAWLTFDAAGRGAFQERVGDHGDPALWTRAAGWALVMTTAMLVHSADDPVIGGIGRHALGELIR
jgi:aminoglycoside phosphotransferase (APT) family kinase protein